MRIAVIGCGNMASAVVKGIYKHNSNVQFFTYTPSMHRARNLASEVNGQLLKSVSEIQDMDYILVGCKPYQFSEVAKELNQISLKKITLVSLMAGIGIEQIKIAIKSNLIIRLMPSIPIQDDEGISLVHGHKNLANTKKYYKFTRLLEGASKVIHLNSQEEFEKLTVVSASGPAYVYYLINAFSKILVEWGFPREHSQDIAIKLFKGASVSASKSSLNLAEQVSKVTSNKGVTIEAITRFDKHGLQNIIQEGLVSALVRSDEIKSEFNLQ